MDAAAPAVKIAISAARPLLADRRYFISVVTDVLIKHQEQSAVPVFHTHTQTHRLCVHSVYSSHVCKCKNITVFMNTGTHTQTQLQFSSSITCQHLPWKFHAVYNVHLMCCCLKQWRQRLVCVSVCAFLHVCVYSHHMVFERVNHIMFPKGCVCVVVVGLQTSFAHRTMAKVIVCKCKLTSMHPLPDFCEYVCECACVCCVCVCVIKYGY